MLSDSLVEQFRVRLAALGLELADLRIGGTPNRPLAQVRIEWPPADPGTPERRVTVEACARASPALDAWVDAGAPRAAPYLLGVSSPGPGRPPPRPPARVPVRGGAGAAAVAGPR